MEKSINPFLFIFTTIAVLGVLLSASIMLPHDRYYRFQAHNDVTTRKADWIYERLHFDPTPVDVALIGTSRMAGGLSGPLIERTYCEATGRKIHVANLAIPVTGRNMHYVLAKEAARMKSPSLFVIELNDIETRRPHPGFIFLADAREVISAPAMLNLNYLSDLLRLPGRQAALFVDTLLGRPAVRKQFDREDYAGANLDLTDIIISIDGRIKSRRITHSPEKMEAMRATRLKGVSPLHLMPKPLHALEYRVSRFYFRKIELLTEQYGGAAAYAYVPAYGAEKMPPALLGELDIEQPVIDLGGAVANDSSMWLDATHFNADGAVLASTRFASALVEQHPQLGEARCE